MHLHLHPPLRAPSSSFDVVPLSSSIPLILPSSSLNYFISSSSHIIQKCIRMNDKISQKKIEAAQSIISAEEVIKKRRNNFDLTLNLLRTDRDRLTLDQVALETQLGRNKKCIDSCHRMQSNKIISLSAAVDRCIKYLNKEISDIEELLETLVGDVCVAAVVFVRSAWLSESIRMACMDAFRQHLRMQVLTKLSCLFFDHHVSLLLSSRHLLPPTNLCVYCSISSPIPLIFLLTSLTL